MVDRNKYNTVIDSLRIISGHYSDCGFDQSIQAICDIKDLFDVKLMFVGHYNAGKSSLLNGLIQRPGFLKEAQLPQTAVAAELKFDQNEQYFAYRFDGEKEPLTEESIISPDKYRHLEFRIPAAGLERVSDYTIVDTPGFDSGVETHAKALANYLGMGSAYLVVVDQEKGGIDETTLQFIEEISHYSDQIGVLINKCDKITESTAEEIRAYAKNVLMDEGFLYPVHTISKWDEDLSNKLVSIISHFNAQVAFDRAMENQIRTELINLASILDVTQQKLYLDTFDLDVEIRAFSRAEEQVEQAFLQQQKEATTDLDNVTEQVVTEVRNALIDKAGSVAQALLSGSQTAAEAIIVETVRPVMLSSMKDIGVRQIDGVASALDFSGIVSTDDRKALVDMITSLASNLKYLIDQGTFESKPPKDTKGEKRKRTSLHRNLDSLIKQGLFENGVTGKPELSSKDKTLYRAAAGTAAILTDVVAPWVEVVIILLPDVVSLLNGLFGETSADQVKRLFINNIVPQICNKIYPQVRQNIEFSAQQILSEYKNMLDEKLKQIKDSLASAEKQKREKVDSFETYKKQLSEDRNQVRKLIEQMG